VKLLSLVIGCTSTVGNSLNSITGTLHSNIVRSLYPQNRLILILYLSATSTLSIDLSRNWTNTTVQIGSTIKPENCASLNSPSLWYHEEEDTLYSGFTGWPSFNRPPPYQIPISIWTFKPDGFGNGQWTEVIPPRASALASLLRPSDALQAFAGDFAWALGGYNQNIQGLSGLPVLPGLIQFDMSSKVFQNISSTGYTYNGGGVAKGAMQYVPSFGPQGIFVAMGGNGNPSQNSYPNCSFSTVAVFDPQSQQWWNQTTTGAVPTPRINFCTAGVNSTNNTFEMYLKLWGPCDWVG